MINLHPDAAKVLAERAAAGLKPLADQTPAAVRAAALPPIQSNQILHEIRDLDADGVPCRFYRPALDREDCGPSDNHTLGLVIFIHGGGWVLGTLEQYDNLCRHLANQSGQAVLSVDYRLAPEHSFPAPLDDCLKVARWAHTKAETELNCDSTRICVAGDSAGGNLATLVAQLSFVPLKLQVLIYPVCDCRYLYDSESHRSLIANTGNSYDIYGNGKCGLSYEDMRWFFRHYISGSEERLTDPLVQAMLSPLLAGKEILAVCPPTLILTAECDVLRNEAEQYAERLKSTGVAVQLVRYPGQIHGFVGQLVAMADAREAVHHVSYAIRRALHKDSKGMDQLFASVKKTQQKSAVFESKFRGGIKSGKKKMTQTAHMPQYAQPLRRHYGSRRESWGSKGEKDSETGADLDFVRFLISQSTFAPSQTGAETGTATDALPAVEEIATLRTSRYTRSNYVTNTDATEAERYRSELRTAAEHDRKVKVYLAKKFDSDYRTWLHNLSNRGRTFQFQRSPQHGFSAAANSSTHRAFSLDAASSGLDFDSALDLSPARPPLPLDFASTKPKVHSTPLGAAKKKASLASSDKQPLRSGEEEVHDIAPMDAPSPVHSRCVSDTSAMLDEVHKDVSTLRQQEQATKRAQEQAYMQWVRTCGKPKGQAAPATLADWHVERQRLLWLAKQKRTQQLELRAREKATEEGMQRVAAQVMKTMRAQLPSKPRLER